jgi:hypothetical protein
LLPPSKLWIRASERSSSRIEHPARRRSPTYEYLDFVHGANVFLNALAGASRCALHQGLISVGAEDHSILIFSELMDSESLFLTANADTVYFLGIVDLSDGPMVVETPPEALGIFDDMWFQWIIDFGLPGPDRGAGGKFLLVGPGYDGALPDSGFHIVHASTSRVLMLGRSFMQNDDPQPTVERIKSTLKLYRHVPGATARVSPRCWKARSVLERPARRPRRHSSKPAARPSTPSPQRTLGSSSC